MDYVKRSGGDEFYYRGEVLHRDDGPAVIRESGHRAWYQYGIWHREDGPAIIWASGEQEWFINGERIRNRAQYQELTGLSDNDMLILILKYGGITEG